MAHSHRAGGRRVLRAKAVNRATVLALLLTPGVPAVAGGAAADPVGPDRAVAWSVAAVDAAATRSVALSPLAARPPAGLAAPGAPMAGSGAARVGAAGGASRARAGTPIATVATGGGPLTARGGPSTVDPARGQLPHGARAAVTCQVFGQRVTGPQGRSPYWNRLADGRYIADAYVRWRPARPALSWCGASGGAVTATVAGGSATVRRGPGTTSARTGALAGGATLQVRCQVWGERVEGPGGATHAWNRLGAGRYVSDAVVAWRPGRPTLPWCGQAPPTVPAATAEEFIARMAGPARQGMRTYRVPASVTIAQAILESGWGRSGLARRDHNYFGIKCFGTPGAHALGCRTYATSECGRGRCWRTTATFRAYRDAAGSLTDHGHFLVVNPRYRPAFQHTGDANRFAREIHKAGYATSPTYAANLIGIMKRYDLYRFDRR